ncbi:hypothetical protein BD309DRAFT_1085207 [Dichomitus squalens]|uniref:Uncharacterized protein n=1 Tax=Dichomitus squalens TaxID=114155 RepID=A0A4Q9N7P8_9APHY|nr:hypothetical protein BD309DRAFT_1085207 [Dichomitus squalens]TBU60292.1 hypothetical protein BD310DRAFT_1037978 [Dichomitus squalens]
MKLTMKLTMQFFVSGRRSHTHAGSEGKKPVTVNDLPAEVLAYISEIVQMKHWQDGSPAWGSYRWTYVSWVCRYWRWIALASPALWTTIWIDTGDRSRCNLAWVAASIERAAGAPLDVSVLLRPSGVESWGTLYDLLLPFVSAIRRFAFTFCSGLNSDLALTWFAISMVCPKGSLEVLKLGDDSQERHSSAMLLEFLTSRLRLQKLRVLELTNLHLPTSPNLSACRSLRSLSIKGVFPHPNAIDLLSILSDCPRLETLAVDFCHASTQITDRIQTSIPSVTMPSLRSLLIRGDLADTVYACDRILVLPTCIIQIFHRSVGRPLPPGIMLSIVLPKQAVFRSVISICTRVSLYIVGDIPSMEFDDSDGKMRICVHADIPSPGASTITQVWEDFTRMLSTVATTDFALGCDKLHQVTVDMWSDSLSWMPTLESLNVLGDVDVVDKMRESAPFPAAMFEALATVSTASETARCLRLRRIQLLFMVLDRITEEAFLRALQLRASLGLRLERVTFVECYRTNPVGEDFKRRIQEYADVFVVYESSSADADADANAFRTIDWKAPTTQRRKKRLFNYLTRLVSCGS